LSSCSSAPTRRKEVEIEGQRFGVLGRDDLVRNKKAYGRPKDQADAAWLQSDIP
jgi:hypothetical protein